MSRGGFHIVNGATACRSAKPDQGMIKRGTAVSPWTGEAIDGDYIKGEAQAGRMGQQLYAKKSGDFTFRAPLPEDAAAYLRIFPSYYATAEKVRDFLSRNKV